MGTQGIPSHLYSTHVPNPWCHSVLQPRKGQGKPYPWASICPWEKIKAFRASLRNKTLTFWRKVSRMLGNGSVSVRASSPYGRCSLWLAGWQWLKERTQRNWEFPGGPVVRTPSSHCRGPGFNPGGGTKILQEARCGQNKRKKEGRKEGLGWWRGGKKTQTITGEEESMVGRTQNLHTHPRSPSCRCWRGKHGPGRHGWCRPGSLLEISDELKLGGDCNFFPLKSRLLKWYWQSGLQGRNRDTDVENKRMDAKGGKWRGGVGMVVGWIGRLGLTYIH